VGLVFFGVGVGGGVEQPSNVRIEGGGEPISWLAAAGISSEPAKKGTRQENSGSRWIAAAPGAARRKAKTKTENWEGERAGALKKSCPNLGCTLPKKRGEVKKAEGGENNPANSARMQ